MLAIVSDGCQIATRPVTLMVAAGYPVTYNGNGNSDGYVPTDTNYYAQGTTITVAGNIGSLVNGTYYFAGWNTAMNGTGISYPAGSTFVMGTFCNVTLYAKWVSSFALRDRGPAGGWIFYVDPSDAKLLPPERTYLEAAPSDQSTWIAWSDITASVPGGTGTPIGMGQTNTANIMAQSTNSAAYLCHIQTIGDYNDWFMPSKDELNKMYVNLKSGTDEHNVVYSPIAGFDTIGRWSSSEAPDGPGVYTAWLQDFLTGGQSFNNRIGISGLRAVRTF